MTDLVLRNGITPEQPKLPPTSERVAVAGGAMRVALPLALDDLTAELGDREYLAMGCDGGVTANLNLYASSVVADDPQFVSAITDKTKPGYAAAARLVTWLSAQVEALDDSLHSV